MRNYIILNNKSSNDINGLIIQELAPISKPQQRTQVETIDGRDGDIVTPLGYAAYNKKIKIGLYGDFDINEIIAYFATKGTAIFSNEPDKYYNYQILDQIDYERLVRFRVATVTMHVQPFKYSATEGTITVDASDTVSGEGSDIALDGTAEAPFTTLRYKGNATQQTYSGKNIFSGFGTLATGSTYTADTGTIVMSQSSTNTSYDIPVLASTAYYLNFTTANQTRIYIREYDSGGNMVANITKYAPTGFTTTATTVKTVIYFSPSTSEAFPVTVKEIQLEKGSAPTSFEKYTAGPSPNPDYPQAIETVTGEQTVGVTGKNLFGGLTEYYVSYCTYTLANNILTITPADTTHNPGVGFLLGAPIPSGATIHLSSATTVATSTQLRDSSNAVVANFGGGIDTTRTLSGTAERIVFNYLSTGSTAPFTVDLSTLQLEVGSSSSAYESYRGQSYKVNLGKNLANIYAIPDVTGSVRTVIVANDTITISGNTNTAGYVDTGIKLKALCPELRVGDVCYLFFDTTSSAPNKDYVYTSGVYWAKGQSKTITQAMLDANVVVYGGHDETAVISNFMITKSSDSSYAPYFTPIELAAIGDYADEPVKVGDTWYIRHKIGKVVLDGTEENWALANATTGYTRANLTTLSSPQMTGLCDKFTFRTGAHGAYEYIWFRQPSTGGGCFIQVDTARLAADTLAAFKAWLASNPTTVYYVLAAPTDEEITNQALIDQLDDIYEQAHSYKGRTHITANAQGDNAPAVLSVEVGENNETTVTNAGNTASRPIITIYGQGNIGMYINDVQVLDIALGDEQYITIDSVAMEAYKDSTANLKNRLVTGDYSKLALNVGDNKIYFTGIVTKYEISKYSRWL